MIVPPEPEREETVWAELLRLSVPPLTARGAEAAERDAPVLTVVVPADCVKPPVKELLPVKVREPAPCLVRERALPVSPTAASVKAVFAAVSRVAAPESVVVPKVTPAVPEATLAP